jgi:hypothetical protein
VRFKYQHLLDLICICICRLIIFCLLKLNVIILELVFVNPKFIRCQIGLLKLYEGALEASKDKFLLTKAAPDFVSHVLG